MLARAALVLSAVFLAFVMGFAFSPALTPPIAAAHPLRLAALRLDAPAATAATAAAALAGLYPSAAPPVAGVGPAPPPRATPPPPPPPPPGVEEVLRASLTAVADDHGRLRLLLAGSGPVRRLQQGDAFMGWRLASVTRGGAVLSRGSATRAVSFFAAPRPAPAVAGVLGSSPGRAASAPPPAPTAAEYFRGFKG